MKDYLNDLDESLSRMLDEKMKIALANNGFDCDKHNNFEMSMRVRITENFNNGRKELFLDDKCILCFSSVQTQIDFDKVTAYINVYEPK